MTTTSPIGEVALAYFEDLAASHESEHAEPESPAYYYSVYLDDTNTDVGIESTDVEVDGTTVTITWSGMDGTTSTATIDDIEVSAAGVRDYVIDGIAMSERIAVSTEPVAASGVDGVEATRAISYLTLSNSHVVAMTVTNGTDEMLRSGPVSFVTSDGQQADSNLYLGPIDVRPAATATLVFEFASNDLPTGTLYYDAYIEEPSYTPVSLVVNISL